MAEDTVLKPMKAEVSEDDIKKVARMTKDDLLTYCRDHFPGETLFKRTDPLRSARVYTVNRIHKAIGVSPNKESIKKADATRKNLKKTLKAQKESPYDENGDPKWLKNPNSDTVWKANKWMILNLQSNGYTPVDKDGTPLE